jgi:hypothetical protein
MLWGDNDLLICIIRTRVRIFFSDYSIDDIDGQGSSVSVLACGYGTFMGSGI